MIRHATVLVLVAAVFTSAMAVVLARHQNRKLFVELQALNQQRDALNDEWGRLQLEQATWGAHGRVEDLARSKLGMTVPMADQIILVEP